MATDYGGAHGGQPWHGAQPPYPGEPEFGGSPGQETPPDPAGQARGRRARFLAWTLLALGLLGVAGRFAGLMNQWMPRKFTAAQLQQITDWEYGKRWRALPAGVIFPAAVRYPPPATLDDSGPLTLSARRIGVAAPATCAVTVDPAAAAILDGEGCTTVLRASYADATDSYVLTVGAAVLPTTTQAAAAARALDAAGGASGLGPTVRTVKFAGTPAAHFTGSRRQLSGVVSAGTYVVLYTVGFADTRPRQPVSGDSYADGEMVSAGAGVAHAVLSLLAAPVPSPHCPGTSGC